MNRTQELLLSFVSNVYGNTALAGVAQQLGHRPTHQKVMASVPRQGHVPGFQVRSPACWGVCGRQPIDVALSHRCFSLPSPSLPSTLWKSMKNIVRWGLTKKKKMKLYMSISFWRGEESLHYTLKVSPKAKVILQFIIQTAALRRKKGGTVNS